VHKLHRLQTKFSGLRYKLINARKEPSDRQFLVRLAICSIFFLAFCLRFTHLNWDEGYYYHPDERNIAAAISRLELPQQNNPEFYAYNGFPLFFLDIVSQIVSHLTHNPDWLTDWPKIILLTRIFSAACSFISVRLCYRIALKVFRPKIAILTTFIAATTVGLIQYAHYGVTESLLVMEVLLLSLLSMQLMENKKKINLFWLAVVFGVSVGTKTSALSFILIPALAILMTYGLRWRTVLMGICCSLVAAAVFYGVSPNTIQHLDKFLESMRYEGGVVRGEFLVPYTMQFIDTPIYLFQIKNLFWQTSISTMLLAFFGLFLLFKNGKKYRLLWPLLLYSFLYFVYVGSWHAKFIRYMLPIVPAIIFLSGIALNQLTLQLKKPRLKQALILIVCAVNVFWALAYVQVFIKQSTRITASKWMYQYIPNQSTVLTEHWDDGLPSMSEDGFSFNHLELKLYDYDDQAKVQELADTLSQGDYLVISSRRLTGSILRNQAFPYTTKYYQLLFSGDLGYDQVAIFTSYPNFFGLNINDDSAEETFQVYDHPVVKIFKNIGHFSSAKIESLILSSKQKDKS